MSSPGRNGALGFATAQVLLRTAVGATLIAHGAKHGRSLAGTEAWFRSIGFRNAKLQATASAAVEIGAGSALVIGAAVPLSAAAAVGTMAVAAKSVHIRNGFFITSDGWEYVMNLAAAAVAVAALGAGPLSVDRAVGWDRRMAGVRGAAVAGGIGLAGAAVQLAAFYRSPSEATR